MEASLRGEEISIFGTRGKGGGRTAEGGKGETPTLRGRKGYGRIVL